jgi:hypothetical protein
VEGNCHCQVPNDIPIFSQTGCKTTKGLRPESRSSVGDLNLELPEYEAGIVELVPSLLLTSAAVCTCVVLFSV